MEVTVSRVGGEIARGGSLQGGLGYMSSHMCSHTHTHTHAHTHFDIGTGTVGLPSLQALVGGGGSLLSSHIFQGGGGFRTTFRVGG